MILQLHSTHEDPAGPRGILNPLKISRSNCEVHSAGIEDEAHPLPPGTSFSLQFIVLVCNSCKMMNLSVIYWWRELKVLRVHT